VGEELAAVYPRFLQLADQKREVYDEDLHALMGSADTNGSGMVIKNISVSTRSVSAATATVTLELNGHTVTDAACGNGPVDAVFKTIDRLVGKAVNLEDYTLKSVSRGSEALGDATVKIRCDEAGLVVGRGISTDVIEASAKAYLNALSKVSTASK
jgi:2-isopropylmalate synthase